MLRSPRPLSWIALTVVGALGCGSSIPREFSADGLTAPSLVPPLAMPNLVLRMTERATFDLKRETERYLTLLFLGYTGCADICSGQLASIPIAMQRMDSSLRGRTKVSFVTVGRRRDTPTVPRQWLNRFGRRLIGLNGESGSVAFAFTRCRLGQPMAPVAVEADA